MFKHLRFANVGLKIWSIFHPLEVVCRGANATNTHNRHVKALTMFGK